MIKVFGVATLIIARINQGLCPVCEEPLSYIQDIVFEDFERHKQPVHRRHVKYEKTEGGAIEDERD